MKHIQRRAVIYLRVSTEEQLNNFSLHTQEDLCREEAQRRGYEIEKIFKEEGKSAKSINGRPELITLLAYCRKNQKRINALIVYRLDRLSRQTADYLVIRKKLNDFGITILSTTEPTGTSPTEKLIETILAGFAQLENDIRGERSRNGMRTRFMSGLPNGAPPPGYLMVNGYVVKDTKCFDQIKKAWDIMATGTKSCTEMMEILNDFKLINGKTGKQYTFTRKNIYRIFRSKYYSGVIVSKTYHLEVQALHIPMVNHEQFATVQKILDGKNKNAINITVRNKNNEDFPLRRFITCATCGFTLTASWSQGRYKKYAYYHCTHKCKNSYVPRNHMHQSFAKLLKDKPMTTVYTALYLTILENVFQNRFAEIKQKQTQTTSQMSKLMNLRQTLIDKNLAGIYSDQDFKEQFNHIENQLHSMAILRRKASLEMYTKKAAQEYIKKILRNLPKLYDACDIKQKRAITSLLFPRGLIWNYVGLSAAQ